MAYYAVHGKYLLQLHSFIPISIVVTYFRDDMKLVCKGRELIGLSPFNREKTPSFTVVDCKKFYHCFSSGRSGNAISYLIDAQGMHHRRAVKFLEEIFGGQIRTDKWQRGHRPKRRRTRHRGGEKRSPGDDTPGLTHISIRNTRGELFRRKGEGQVTQGFRAPAPASFATAVQVR